MPLGTKKREKCGEKEAVDYPSAEPVHEKTPDFISQLETAFKKHLPEHIDLDSFVEKVVSAYLLEPKKKYDDDFFFDIIKPMIKQIIDLKDGLENNINTFNDLLGKDDPSKALSFAQEVLKIRNNELASILEYYDVTQFKDDCTKFNPLKQTVIATIPTEDEAQFKKISKSLSYGYARNGRVISKERVEAFEVKRVTQPES